MGKGGVGWSTWFVEFGKEGRYIGLVLYEWVEVGWDNGKGWGSVVVQ